MEKVVCKIVKFKTNQRWDNSFKYVVFIESDLPDYYECPSSVLKFLTKTNDPNSLEWRNMWMHN